MIEGVKIKKPVRHADDRGYFIEILRCDEGWLSGFGQASMSRTYPGIIRAFHYHENQDDAWFFPVGNVQAGLVDLRPDSPSCGEKNSFYTGEDNPLVIFIPRMVAHGFRVLGNRPAILVYLTTNPYNPEKPDEKRISWDDPGIGFDWTTRNR